MQASVDTVWLQRAKHRAEGTPPMGRQRQHKGQLRFSDTVMEAALGTVEHAVTDTPLDGGGIPCASIIIGCVVQRLGRVLASRDRSAEVHARAEQRRYRPSDACADESIFLDALREWHAEAPADLWPRTLEDDVGECVEAAVECWQEPYEP